MDVEINVADLDFNLELLDDITPPTKEARDQECCLSAKTSIQIHVEHAFGHCMLQLYTSGGGMLPVLFRLPCWTDWFMASSIGVITNHVLQKQGLRREQTRQQLTGVDSALGTRSQGMRFH